MYPPGICWNIFGRVINTKPSSEAGSIPKAKTAGKIAIPARTAIKVSANETLRAVFARFSFFLIYEP